MALEWSNYFHKPVLSYVNRSHLLKTTPKLIKIIGNLSKYLAGNMLEILTFLISIFCGVIFWRHNQTSPLSRTTVNGFDDVNEFLLVFNRPIYFVVISGAQINHNVLVSEEKHHCAWVVEFVHFVKIWHPCDINQIKHRKISTLFGDWK